jgi:hypothetical protein
MFEPTRLSGEHLIDAYSQVVPMRPRCVRRALGHEQRAAVARPARASRRQGR